MSNVLLVDDSATMRKIVKRKIKEIGFTVDEFFEAGDGKQALEIVFNNSVDLILLDWNMPVMNGLEFVQTLSSVKLPKKITVIMLTTEGSPEKITEATSSGVDSFLLKPVTTEHLREGLKNYLSRA